MSKRKIFFVLFPLFLGVAIYFLYRSRNLFYFKIFTTHPVIYSYVIKIRDIAWLYRKHLPLWTVYSLPDGLWLFSFGATLLLDRVFYLLHFTVFTAIYIFMVALEFLQKRFGGHGSLLGTFDKLDILFFTLGYISIVLISNFFHRRDKKHSSEIALVSRRKEIVEDIKYCFIFTILGALPSLF